MSADGRGTSVKNVEKLHSWKRIANYLNRSVRTARRWEEHENLPIRRHQHVKSPTVFAYAHELEQWLRGREQPNSKLPNDDDDALTSTQQFIPSW